MNVLQVLSWLAAGLVLVLTVPVFVYYCVKLGTVAFFRGKRLAEELEKEKHTNNGRSDGYPKGA